MIKPTGNTQQQDVDDNGIRLGRWDAGFCGCCDSCFPNCCTVTWCPCISVAQIAARVGSASYCTALLGMLVVTVGIIACPAIAIAAIEAAVRDAVDNPLTTYLNRTDAINDIEGKLTALGAIAVLLGVVHVLVVCQLRSRIRTRLRIPGNCFFDLCVASLCFPCCTIAQMATHVKCYTRGTCVLGEPDVLPAYV